MKSFDELAGKLGGLNFLVGVDSDNRPIYSNLEEITHLLVCGASGTGKSAFVESMLFQFICAGNPRQIRTLIVNSTGVDYSAYSNTPFQVMPVISDPDKVCFALEWLAAEVVKRLRAMSEVGARKLSSYNDKAWESFARELPKIIVVIDDFSHLIQKKPRSSELISQIILNGRSVGVHIIAVTQAPTCKEAKKISLMFGDRMVFSLSSSESRAIIGKSGAEFLDSPGSAKFLSNGEIIDVRTVLPDNMAVQGMLGQFDGTSYDETAMRSIGRDMTEGVVGSVPEEVSDEYDELLPAAIEVVVETGMASVSMLQRRLKLGYSRAARLVDQMEEKGVVGPFEGSKPRQVLITKEQWQELQYKQGMTDLAPDAPPVSEPVPEELEYEGDVNSRKTVKREKRRGLIRWIKNEIRLQKEYREELEKQD